MFVIWKLWAWGLRSWTRGDVNLVHFECGLKCLCIIYIYDGLPLFQFFMWENITKENKGVSTKIVKWAIGPRTLALIVWKFAKNRKERCETNTIVSVWDFFGSLFWIFSLWRNNYQYFQKEFKDVRSFFLQNDHLKQFFVTSFVHFEMDCFWKYISCRVNFIVIDCLKYISLLQWWWTIFKRKIVISHIGDRNPWPLVDLFEYGPTICCMKFKYIEKDCWSLQHL